MAVGIFSCVGAVAGNLSVFFAKIKKLQTKNIPAE
jgi:hypothetical protein